MRRAFSAATIVAALALAVAACGGGDTRRHGGPRPVRAADPLKISGEITWWDTVRPDSEGPTFQALIKDFQAKYPNIKVKYVNVPFDQAQNQFKTAAQAGTGAPDVIRSEVAWTSQFASLGYLQPLDGTRAAGERGRLPARPAEQHQVQRQDLRGAAGHRHPGAHLQQEAPQGGRAREGSHHGRGAQAGRARRQGQDRRRAASRSTSDSYFLLPFIYGEGGDLLDVQNKKITVNSPANVKAMATVVDLVTSGAAPKPAIQDSYANAMTALKDGKTAMIYNGPWALSEIYQGKEFQDKANLGIAPVPAGSVKAGAPTGGRNLAIYAGSRTWTPPTSSSAS